MPDKNESTIHEDRKVEHLELIYKKGMQSSRNWMEDVFIHPSGIPTIDPSDVDISCPLFGRKFGAPIYIAAMTGGHTKTKPINEGLAKICAERNIPLGLGSQRAAIENESLADTYRIARDVSSDLFLIGNIGMSQLIKSENPIRMAARCVEMIEANALAIHFNKLQELCQPEGDRIFSKILDILDFVIHELDVPIIIKEVGFGFGKKDLQTFSNVHAGAIDVGGFGGTNFAVVEANRVNEKESQYTRKLGNTFKDVGTPTPASIMLAMNYVNSPILATGGIRTGLDVVKCLSLGANMAGLAYPFLVAYYKDLENDTTKGMEYSLKELDTIINEIKVAFLLLNAKSVDNLTTKNVHISEELERWLQ